MFRSAVLKLTLWYVGALITVCVLLSVPVYILSSQRLAHGANRQIEFVLTYPQTAYGQALPPDIIATRRRNQLEEDRKQLLKSVVAADVAIILLGASLSYLFAKRTLKPIEEMHESQTRFTADASHELRTPLAVMQTEAEIILRQKSASKEELRSALRSNLEEIARLRQLSDQLLELSRLDVGSANMQIFNLSKAIKTETLEQSRTHDIQINTELAKNVMINGIEPLIKQVISILIDNAIKYARSSSPRISISVKKQGRSAIITCQDNGIGIKEEDRDKVFERFFRASNARSPGHGLGLSLAKEIVERHHGTISVSRSKGYTIFEIKLPLS